MRLVAILFLAFAVFLGIRLRAFGLGREIIYNDGDCHLISNASLHSSEDLEFLDDTTVIGTAGNLFHGFLDTAATPNGHIFIADLSRGTQNPIPIDWGRRGDAKPFLPHGMHYSRKTGRVIVVNHPGDYEEIVIFQLRKEPFRLEYLRSIVTPLISRYSMNDVIEGGNSGELYVTQWLTFPMPLGGRHKATLLDHAIELVAVFTDHIFALPTTAVYRCLWDDSVPTSEATCHVAAPHMVTANGISINDNRDIIVVSELSASVASVFRRGVSGDLTRIARVSLPYPVDNFVYDEAADVFTGGTIPNGLASVAYMTGDASAIVPGGSMQLRVITQASNPSEAAVELEYDQVLHDGKKLSMISTALHRSKKWILGSPFSSGILVCPDRH